MNRESTRQTGESSDDRVTADASRRRFLKAAATTGALAAGLGTGVASAAVTEADVRLEGTSTGTETNEASIDVRGGNYVAVEGTIPAPDPCHTVRLGDVRVEDDTLRIPIEAVPDRSDGGVCVAAMGNLDYFAEVSLDDYVSTVVVEHAGTNSWRREFEPEYPSAVVVPPVGGLTVEPAGPTSLAVEWGHPLFDAPTEDVSLDHVNVYVDGKLDHRVEHAASDDPATTVTGLSPGTTYEVGVSPVDANGLKHGYETETETTAASTATEPGTEPPTEPGTETTEPGTSTPGEVIDASVSVEGVTNGSATSETAVAFGSDTVVVHGELAVGNPCRTAVLGDVGIEDGTLRVPVRSAADPESDGGCIEVLATVEYVAEVSLRELPSTVVVEHDGLEPLRREFDAPDTSGPISPRPVNLAVAETTPTTVSITWELGSLLVTDTTPLDHVDVYVDGEIHHRIDYDDAPTDGPTETTVDGLSPGTTYEVALVGADAVGNEIPKRTVTARTAAGTTTEPRTADPGTTTSPGTTAAPRTTTTAPSETGATPGMVGPNTAYPRDPDGDGLFEDVNGNARQDIADAVDLFRNRNDVDPQFFDFTESGGVSIGDAVSLFRENTG